MPDLAPWEQEEQERWRAQPLAQPEAEPKLEPKLEPKPKPVNSWWRVLLSLLSLLLCVSFTVWLWFPWGAGQDADSPQPPEIKSNREHPGWITPTGTRFTPDEILQRSSASVVAVYAKHGGDMANSGTGFFIDGGGRVLTNFHVVEGSGKIIIRMKDGKTYPIFRVAAQSPEWDLALLEVNMPIADSIALNIAPGLPPISSDVCVVGTPKGMPHILSTGALTEVKGTELEMIQFSAPISPGFSGSPVFNDRGSVIGIATHGTAMEGKGVGLGASSLVIARFLKDKPFIKKDDSPAFETTQGLLPDGGYTAYTVAPTLDARLDHSALSEVVAVVPRKTKVKVKREWVETNRHAARLTRDLTIRISGVESVQFKAGDAAYLINPDISGSGILVRVGRSGEEFQIVLNEEEIDRLYQKTWCQAILPSRKVGWFLKHDLKI